MEMEQGTTSGIPRQQACAVPGGKMKNEMSGG